MVWHAADIEALERISRAESTSRLASVLACSRARAQGQRSPFPAKAESDLYLPSYYLLT